MYSDINGLNMDHFDAMYFRQKNNSNKSYLTPILG